MVLGVFLWKQGNLDGAEWRIGLPRALGEEMKKRLRQLCEGLCLGDFNGADGVRREAEGVLEDVDDVPWGDLVFAADIQADPLHATHGRGQGWLRGWQ